MSLWFLINISYRFLHVKNRDKISPIKLYGISWEFLDFGKYRKYILFMEFYRFSEFSENGHFSEFTEFSKKH